MPLNVQIVKLQAMTTKSAISVANMDNRPPKWTFTGTKKTIETYKQAKEPSKPKMERQQQPSSTDLN